MTEFWSMGNIRSLILRFVFFGFVFLAARLVLRFFIQSERFLSVAVGFFKHEVTIIVN